jgi:hypothetical protein
MALTIAPAMAKAKGISIKVSVYYMYYRWEKLQPQPLQLLSLTSSDAQVGFLCSCKGVLLSVFLKSKKKDIMHCHQV